MRASAQNEGHEVRVTFDWMTDYSWETEREHTYVLSETVRDGSTPEFSFYYNRDESNLIISDNTVEIRNDWGTYTCELKEVHEDVSITISSEDLVEA